MCDVFLDACRVGVPQQRKRVFVIGVRTNKQDLACLNRMNQFMDWCRKTMHEAPTTSVEEAIPELKGKNLFIFPRRKDAQSVFACSRPSPCVRSMILSKPVPSILEVEQNAEFLSLRFFGVSLVCLQHTIFRTKTFFGSEKYSVIPFFTMVYRLWVRL